MKTLSYLFENNKKWSDDIKNKNDEFFVKLSHQQKPKLLWIGCSDSRVPANEIVGLLPGELFVHRNISNLVIHSDMNCLSVIQYAVEVLKIEHIIVCGHYSCGGVMASLDENNHGMIDNWLRHIKDTYTNHKIELESIKNFDEKVNRLCEINVVEQVRNVCNTTFVKDRWKAKNDVSLSIHGWIYGIENGLLKDLDVTISSLDEFKEFEK